MTRTKFSKVCSGIVALSFVLLSVSPPASAVTRPHDAEPDTWLLQSADQLRLPPPPGNNSRTTRRELTRLRRLQSQRTSSIKKSVRRWNRHPATVRWTELALDMILKYKQRPPAAARLLALLHLGMDDALTAARDTRQAYFRAPPAKLDRRIRPLLSQTGSSYPPDVAVAAGAAETLLKYVFPNEPAETFRRLATKATRSRLWAGANYPSDLSRGRQLGRDVAALFLEHGENDGHYNTGFSNPRPDGEEYWEKTPPAYEDATGGPVGTWRPWVMASPRDARIASGVSGPHAYDSEPFMSELREVMEVAETLTDEQRSVARAWDDGLGTYTPSGHWNQIALAEVISRRVGTRSASQLFAHLNAALYDAAIASFEAKYVWWSIRPVTIIRRLCDGGERLCAVAELDPSQGGDPERATFPEWEPFLHTPPFPSYLSGHATFSGAASTVLGYFFPDSIEEFAAMAEEAALSRLHGGIHFRSDNEDGLSLGRAIGDLVVQRAGGWNS